MVTDVWGNDDFFSSMKMGSRGWITPAKLTFLEEDSLMSIYA